MVWLGPRARERQDLLKLFLSSDAGDEVLAKGIIVPILAIDDGGYEVIVRSDVEISPFSPFAIVENAVFAFETLGTVAISDLAVLKEWSGDVDDSDLQSWPAGRYEVTVRGFQKVEGVPRELVAAGYEFVMRSVANLPIVTANTGRNMRVMNWWDRQPSGHE